MTNWTTYPRENQYESQIVGEISDGATAPFDITVKQPPGFTLSGGDTVYAVLEPGTSKEEGIEIKAISSTTLTVGARGLPTAKGGSATTTSHGGGSTIIFSDNWQTFDDIATAVNSKLDNDGGNATTTFDLEVSGSDFRIRKDGNDMKFTDDNQSETTLSTLAATGGSDEKVGVTASDTTPDYLNNKITAGDGLSKATVNPGADEEIDIDVDLTDTTIFKSSASGTGDSGKVLRLDSRGNIPVEFVPTYYYYPLSSWTEANNGAGSKTVTDAAYVALATGASSGDYETYWRALANSTSTASLNFLFNDLDDGDKVIFEIPVQQNGSSDHETFFGFGEDVDDAHSNVGSAAVCKFRINGSTINTVVCDGTGAVTETTISPATASDGLMWRIELTLGTDAKFYADGVLQDTQNTNIPLSSDPVRIYFFVGVKTGTTAAKTSNFGLEPNIYVSRRLTINAT